VASYQAKTPAKTDVCTRSVPERPAEQAPRQRGLRRIAAELPNIACEVAEGWPFERKEGTSRRRGPPRLDLVYPRSNPARAYGKIEAKTVDQFHILGKITVKIPGRATRTERELNVD
jgi:hypothetical protein